LGKEEREISLVVQSVELPSRPRKVGPCFVAVVVSSGRIRIVSLVVDGVAPTLRLPVSEVVFYHCCSEVPELATAPATMF